MTGNKSPSSCSDLLKLAVIIPSLNEAQNIQSTISSVAGKPGVTEVIVVDGGSTDRTAALAKATGAKVIKSAPGRGRQLNAGWRASKKADWCLFLHADTQLPGGFEQLLAAAVQPQCFSQQQQWQQERPQPCWGCFSSIRLTQVPHWQSWLVQLAVGLRTRLLHQPYGDQALFIRRSTLEAVQGFPDWKLLEDVCMVQKLKRLSAPAIVPCPVATSGRLYNAAGFWEVVLAHQGILLAHAAGCHPDQLADLRTRLHKQSSTRIM